MTSDAPLFRQGQIALVGRPNVGKSTITNRLLGREASIVTSKPNTTIRVTPAEKQAADHHLLILDTPGIAPASKSTAGVQLESALPDVDLVLLVTRGTQWTKDDQAWCERLAELNMKVIWVLNQMDLVKNKAAVLPLIQKVSATLQATEVVPMAATKTKDIDRLRDLLLKHLPSHEVEAEEAAWLEEQANAEFVANIEPQWVVDCVREQMLWQLHDELPYTAKVSVEQLDDSPKIVRVLAYITVPEARHRKMLIGKRGEQIRDIGTRARLKLEKHWHKKVHLELEVKASK